MKSLRFFLALMMTVPALAAAVQTSVTQTAQAKPSCTCKAHKIQPYTAEFETTSVQTLANGVTITRESMQTMALDSAGRNMNATTEKTPQLGTSGGTSGFANDPIAGTQSYWDSRTKKVIVTKLPPKDQRHGCWANEAGMMRMRYYDGRQAQQNAVHDPGPQPKITTEDLGKTTIQGLEARGKRTTTTIAAGEIGNDQPIVSTVENWWAVDFGLLVRSVMDDPRSGTTTRELVSFTQGEPDSTLFQPPDGYEVKTDELHQVQCSQ